MKQPNHITVMFFSQNKQAQESFIEIFNERIEASSLFIVEDIKKARAVWLENYPTLTFIDTQLPFINPAHFIKTLSFELNTQHTLHQFVFITNTEEFSIAMTKEALSNVRVGSLIIKNILEETDHLDYMKDIAQNIIHVYDSCMQEQQKHIRPNACKEPLFIEGISLSPLEIPIDPHILHNMEVILQKIKNNPIEMIIIGVSTGGPLAIKKLLSLLPLITKPIVIVQHMTPSFIENYIKNLSYKVSFPIEIATQGGFLENKVYFAPDYCHLKINRVDHKTQFLLEHSNPVNGYIPSIEMVFDSILEDDISILGIMMTGMGDDGADNLTLLHNKGCTTIAQSPEDASIFGMPQALIKNKGADAVLTIEMMAEVLNSLFSPLFLPRKEEGERV